MGKTKTRTRIISALLCLAMIISLNWGFGVNGVTAYAVTTGTYNVDTDTLPYAQDVIYTQLFDINNKIDMKIDISNEELQKLQDDYNTYEAKGSKSPIYRKADVYITITTSKDSYTYVINEVGVRMKGNTSRVPFYSSSSGMYNLIHFKLDFQETFDDEAYYTDDAHVWGTDAEGKALRKARKNRTFATLEKMDVKWNRNLDSTYIREYYAYETFRNNGVIAPHTNVAAMNISGSKMGVYTIYEPIDSVFIEKYVAEEDWDGDLYKCGWTDKAPDLTDTSSIGIEDEDANDGHGAFFCYDLKTNKKTSTNEQLKNLITELNKDGVTKTKLASLVDMSSFLKFAAVSYFTGNPDDMRNNYNNYYIYFLKSTGKAIFIPYDLDRCFGVTNGWNPTGNGMTEVSPFSSNAEGANRGQNNPVYKYSVCQGGFYISEFGDALKKVAASKWLTTANFNAIFNKVKNNYSSSITPDKSYNNASKSSFKLDNVSGSSLSADNANASFSVYLNAMMSSYKSYIAKIDNYLAAPLYLRGDFTNWNVDDEYQMNYDKTTKTYSYRISTNKNITFKINNGVDGDVGEWYGYDKITSKPSTMTLSTDADKNITAPMGTYYIYYRPSDKAIWIVLPNQTVTASVSKVTKTYGNADFYASSLGAKVTKENETLSYKTSNSKVIKYNSSTKKFSITGAGNAYIYITAAATKTYSGTTIKIPVTVRKKSQSVSGTSSYTKYYGASSFRINAKTSGTGKLSYTSSNKNVAVVSSTGKVTLKGYGVATITVKAAANTNYNAASKKVVITVKPKAQRVTSARSGSSKTLTVKWLKDSRAKGYQIVYSRSTTFKKSSKITITSNKTTARKITKLSKGKTYYVKVRSYVKIGRKTYYSKYSAYKKVVVK